MKTEKENVEKRLSDGLTIARVIRAAVKLPRKIVVLPIIFYRKYLSQMKARSSCRFTPTCSEYALIAISERGVFAGCFLALRRLLRCHPWNAGGYDPVPPRRRGKTWKNEIERNP